jgi:hypothetical protein
VQAVQQGAATHTAHTTTDTQQAGPRSRVPVMIQPSMQLAPTTHAVVCTVISSHGSVSARCSIS